MTDLASCYFCGAALDERLRRYPLSDSEAAGVVLCDPCHRKLAHVLGAVEADAAPTLTEPVAPEGTGGASSDPPGEVGDHAAPAPDDDPDSRPDPDADADADPGVDRDPKTDTAVATGAGGDGDTDPDATDTNGDTETDAADDAVADGDADGSGGPSVSPETYDKVLRLLRNREFPVERAEIETVAVGAYGLSERECNAVIDLAIERGIVESDGTRLRRPE